VDIRLQKTPLNRATPEVAFGEAERSGQRVQVVIVDRELLHRKVDAGARDLILFTTWWLIKSYFGCGFRS
jgi:hypothetical protein